MERKILLLSEKNSERMDEIETEIDNLDTLDEKMDYVDRLSIWTEFPDEMTDELENDVDEYLRDYVMNS